MEAMKLENWSKRDYVNLYDEIMMNFIPSYRPAPPPKGRTKTSFQQNQIVSDIDFRHTITPTYDARTLVLFNSKIIHPKQSDSNTSSSIQQPHFYHLRHGVTYPKQWVQQRLLADSLMRDNYTKSTASVRPYGALVKWEDSQYNNPTLDFNHMSIYNLKDTHHKN